ncbi:MAG: sodium/solute symporter [Bacteroidales bacterium]|nr:sodium/solute symporter [Bacteroidales bacterium]MCQ2142398.1 sodium/solute symporter [Bacteroidales bacterium]
MTLIDWLIVAFFLGALVTIGYLFSHKNKNIEDYFVAGRSMPGWLVAIAATGTTISAGTFVGSPELGFNTNLTYIMNLIGAIFGGCLVAALILPKLYNAKTITIYGYIGERFGEKSKRANSVMFLLGQLFTSGSRLFIAAIAISVIVFGDIRFQFLMWSIIILGVISTFYTMMGGIKGLLYIDTFQTLLMIFTGVVAFVLVACDLDGLSFREVWDTLTSGGMVKSPAAAGMAPGVAADGTLTGWVPGNKLKMFDPSIDFTKPYTILGGMIGVAFFKVCQYTTDQEFVQRQLACKDVKKAGRSLVASQLISLPVVLVFLGIGLLLYVKYIHDPQASFESGTSFFTDARDVFPQYIKNHIPMGVRGLMITGLLAAALSSFNSAINSMASSFVSDLYLPIRSELGKEIKSDKEQISSSRWMVALMGVLLTGFAIVTCVMQQSSGLNLVDFATGVMCFAYAGMIGVFLTAIFTKRGNARSVIAALVVGMAIIIPLMFQKEFFGQTYIAWTWWCPIGGLISTLVCMLGKPSTK